VLNHFELQGRKLRVEYKKMLPLQERERIEREKRELVEHLNHGCCLLGGGEVGKGQATEDTIVEVVVECINRD
jgi:hypothetical protein